MTTARVAAIALACLVGFTVPASTISAAAPAVGNTRTLDDFDTLAPWTAVSSNQVTAKLHLAPGNGGGQSANLHGLSKIGTRARQAPRGEVRISVVDRSPSRPV